MQAFTSTPSFKLGKLAGPTEVPSEITSGVKLQQVLHRPIASTALHEVSIGSLGSEVDESGRPMEWQATESSY